VFTFLYDQLANEEKHWQKNIIELFPGGRELMTHF